MLLHWLISDHSFLSQHTNDLFAHDGSLYVWDNPNIAQRVADLNFFCRN